MKRIVAIAALIFLSLIQPLSAQGFEAGMRAYRIKNYTTAVREWTPLARAGDAQAQNSLGFMYEAGRGVKKDLKKAADWYRKAAEQGHVRAQMKLGELYEAGRGYGEALKWYQKAAEQGQARAQYTLARLHWFGRGVKKDSAEAAKWYRKAADQNYSRAQSSLGYLYMNGQGVPKSAEEAGRWYRRAADLGNPVAQSRLATLFELGDSVKKDLVEAYFWLTLSTRRSTGKLKKDIDEQRARIATSLSTEQIASVDKRAREWRAERPR